MENLGKTAVFPGGYSRNWGNTAWADMAGLGSKGLKCKWHHKSCSSEDIRSITCNGEFTSDFVAGFEGIVIGTLLVQEMIQLVSFCSTSNLLQNFIVQGFLLYFLERDAFWHCIYHNKV